MEEATFVSYFIIIALTNVSFYWQYVFEYLLVKQGIKHFYV